MHYVMSDIHGYGPRFDSIMRQIELQPDDTLFVLGDVVDRNPDGVQLLLELMHMPNVRMILGNHEFMMLNAIKHPENERLLRLWYDNGGEITHNHFRGLPAEKQMEILKFFKGLEINIDLEVEGKKYLLVHGAPMELMPPPLRAFDDPIEFSVWTRMGQRMRLPDDRTIIFGHTPTIEYQPGFPLSVWKTSGLIGVDCGAAYANGRLCCLRLEDMKEFYSAE